MIEQLNASAGATNASPCLKQWPKIICIDDNPDIHTNLDLRMRSFEVALEHAYYGMQGIVDALKSEPDLILTDMAMPNGDGSYLVESIRTNPSTASVPIIVLSGMRNPKLKAAVLRSGADLFVQKPVRFADLLEQMRRFIPIHERQE